MVDVNEMEEKEEGEGSDKDGFYPDQDLRYSGNRLNTGIIQLYQNIYQGRHENTTSVLQLHHIS